MYVFIKRDNESKKVLTVETIGTYKNKTEQEALDAVQRYNEKNQWGTYYTAVNIEDECLAEAFKFLLGEDKYRRTHKITHVLDIAASLLSSLDEIDNDVYSLRSEISLMRKELKEIKEE